MVFKYHNNNNNNKSNLLTITLNNRKIYYNINNKCSFSLHRQLKIIIICNLEKVSL